MAQIKLLLVEDSAEVTFLVRRLGRPLDLAVIAHANAEQAWKQLQQDQADLAVVDVNLPGASGLDFCRWVRAAAKHRQLPLALFSHWQRPQDIAAGWEAGANFVLSKDLLGQPQEWHERMTEILTWVRGRPPPLSLPWKDTLPTERLLALRFNQMIRHMARAKLGEEVVRVLLQRALGSLETNALPPYPLTADGCEIDVDRLDGQAGSQTMLRFVLVIMEQLWCLVGTAACVPFVQALAAEPQAGSNQAC